MLLLSAKAGLRAAEIAGLTWAMVTDANGRLADQIALANHIAKKGSGRFIPVHPLLRSALLPLQRQAKNVDNIINSERGDALSADSVVN